MSDALVQRLTGEPMPYHLKDRRLTEQLDLTGKVAVVAGGGGVNIGSACVDRLAGLGATVVVADLNAQGAADAAAGARAKWGVTASAHTADFTDWEQTRAIAAAAASAHGHIDIWVNCVGNPTMAGRFQDLTPQQIRADVDRNLLSAMWGAKAALEFMLPRRSGRIITVSSEAGRMSMPFVVPYASSKAGVHGFTRSLARELIGTGVSVAGVAPGLTVSPVLLEQLRQIPAELEASIVHGADRMMSARAGVAEEVANMVAYLCTEAGAYIVGSMIPVSAGMGD